MNESELLLRIERFERTVATCLCVVPLLFSGQCLLVALGAPLAASLFKDFGSKLPGPTQFVLSAWPVLALVAVALPLVSFAIARKSSPRASVIFSTVSGLAVFVLAQFTTVALLLPVFQLGAVAAGG